MSRFASELFEWHERFIGDREAIYDDSHAGRFSTSRNVEMVPPDVQEIVRRLGRRMTIRELTGECYIFYGSCQTVLDFQHCFKKWRKEWDKCVKSGVK